ncbi:MAG: CDP-alcohol phosphatidyltransferase family protein [Candidatus Pacebacteria bacterium]|nr:CDP-alcohol phosphatidyltransferase family protein [Candidatus Paceibacterota bacterium]MDD4897708.1 CDP-alcohol phosphatidyltransferase family protein [Candidatus Paceibacterota bacterium]
MTLSLSLEKIRRTAKKTKCNLWSKYVMRPLGDIFAVPFVYFDFNPRIIIFFRFILEITGAILFLFNYFILGITLIFLGRVFDQVDGNVARALDKTSAWGRYLDEIADMVAKIILWSAISFILFESYSQGKSHIIFSYLALFIPLLELLMFHARDRASLYIREGRKSNKEKVSRFFSKSSVNNKYKVLYFFRSSYDFISMFWLSICIPFLVLSAIFGNFHFYVIFAVFFHFLFFFYEISRKMFYDRLILKKYSL